MPRAEFYNLAESLSPQFGTRSRAADHKERRKPRQWASDNLREFPLPLWLSAVILEFTMITAQPRLYARCGLVGAGIRVGRAAPGTQRDFRIKVNGTFGAKPGAFPLDGCMPGIPAIKIFAQCFGDPRADAFAQRIADIKIFA